MPPIITAPSPATDPVTPTFTSHPDNSSPWMTVAAMLADLVFETDGQGCFTAFGPGPVLGHAAAAMLGTPLAGLLAPTAIRLQTPHPLTEIFSTIRAEGVAWQGSIRLITADGDNACYRLALAPRHAPNAQTGAVIGTYGMLHLATQTTDHHLVPADSYHVPMPPMLDLETSFWTAAIFADDLARRFDRLDVEEHPGTLLYLGFSRASANMITPTALSLAAELRDIIRPTDLLGRINETTIALWCDGMDNLTGAERAAKFCDRLPAVVPGRQPVTAGLATRWSGSADDPQTLMERAAIALRLADLATERATERATGRAPEGQPPVGAWRVWQAD